MSTTSWWEDMSCPRCGDEITAFPALSRQDNKTYICSECGTKEAFFNFFHQGEPLPDLDKEVRL
jgi:transposase